MYYKEREPRKFDYKDEPPKGVSKKAIHMIILLLFLVAAFLFFFPSPRGEGERNGGESNAALSSAGLAAADVRAGAPAC
ncbi:MAG: hypothetical protein LBP73_05860 [Clostridiales Family XIII bacterium]|jgi:hypothetical protein|nr:hypothetical protein [Clostridiales Family XIII bacterium]